MSFVKLDTGILQSTLWMKRAQREIFITALLMAEPRQFLRHQEQYEVRAIKKTGFSAPPGWYGFVPAAGSGIAHAAIVPIGEALDALEELGSPDEESRSADFEGRRLIRIDVGYLVLNFMRYRDYDHGAADRMRLLRQRKKQQSIENKQMPLPVTRNVTVLQGTVTEAETEADVEEEKKKDSPRFDQDEAFASFWKLYPKKSGKKDARMEWDKLRVDAELDQKIAAGLAVYLLSEKVARGFILDPERFLKKRRWEDEPEPAVVRGNGAAPVRDHLGTLERGEGDVFPDDPAWGRSHA